MTEPTEETTTTEQEQPLLTKDEPETEVVKEKTKCPMRNKVCTTVPMEGVDLAMGDGPLEGADPIMFGQMFNMTLEKYANVSALKWKVQARRERGRRLKWCGRRLRSLSITNLA